MARFTVLTGVAGRTDVSHLPVRCIFLDCETCVKDYIICLTNSINRGILYVMNDTKGGDAMKRSVYSLVLMDDVIKAVDEQAYRLGTSRSNLINQILAERLSCVTPEMRMREIFGSVEDIIGSVMQIQQQRSAALLTMRTALEYKYRPTISYKVELERVPEKYLGTLRVQIRTQSEQLTDLFNSFFLYRIKFERGQFAAIGAEYPGCELSSGSFARRLLCGDGLSEEQTGEAIGEYITDLNRAVKTFFAEPSGFGKYAPELEKEYSAMLRRYII